jgi:hypothetical protein
MHTWRSDHITAVCFDIDTGREYSRPHTTAGMPKKYMSAVPASQSLDRMRECAVPSF